MHKPKDAATAPGAPASNVSNGTWSSYDQSTASRPCWTCRRRRLNCDSRLPTCWKCAKGGYECLGYGDRPIVWVGGGRRRPKKKANDEEAAAAAAASSSSSSTSASTTTSASAPGGSRGTATKGKEAKKTKARAAGPKPLRIEPKSASQGSPGAQSLLLPIRSITPAELSPFPSPVYSRGKDLALPAFSVLSPSMPVSVPRSPGVPWMSEVDPQSLKYIEYYLFRCCVECSIYSSEERNPFRQFAVLLETSPLVRHTLVALSAHHLESSSNALSKPQRLELSDAYLGANHPAYTTTAGSTASSGHYAHALVSKSKAMQHLRVALMSSDLSDPVIAACLLLIWVELLENGSSAWKYHLDGMIGLLNLRYKHHQAKPGDSPPASLTSFQNYFEETCLVLDVFGATMIAERRPFAHTYSDDKLHEIFQRAETRSWTGCPAELLEVLCSINWMRHESHVDPDTVQQVFQRLNAFSSIDWAADHPDPDQIQERHHLASAFQHAVQIYGRRALKLVDWEGADSLQQVAHAAIKHLEKISPRDAHFKGALWPAFIAGAEAGSGMDRLIIAGIFQEMYNFLHSFNVKHGTQILNRTWSAHRNAEGSAGACWLQGIHESGEELLLV